MVWAACLPQLLARLDGHPDGAVRQCILELLCRLVRMRGKATDTTTTSNNNNNRALASRLVFPAVVGCRGIDTCKY